jgi:hypothetical protein
MTDADATVSERSKTCIFHQRSLAILGRISSVKFQPVEFLQIDGIIGSNIYHSDEKGEVATIFGSHSFQEHGRALMHQ